MHELSIYPPSKPNAPTRLCISNCDKDGAIVSARIASAIGAISSTRPLTIRPDRYSDKSYFSDIASSFTRYYQMAHNSKLLNSHVVVLSSVHRAALYIAEALHAPVLPLQLISFARNLEEAAQSPLLSIIGADYGEDSLWQWNKISDVSHFPQSYVDLIQNADDVVIVRSIDNGDDCPVEGRIGNLFVNSTLRSLRPRLWEEIQEHLSGVDGDYNELRQWEWGLPDVTVAAAQSLWTSLGKPIERFHVVELGTIDLFKRIPYLWEAYLKRNDILIRGVTLNSYWIAHPYYERVAGLIPIHFYRFSMLQSTAQYFLDKYADPDGLPSQLCAFMNNVGSEHDTEEAHQFISKIGLDDKFWFSMGFDCPDAECKDVYGYTIPRPYQKISEWIMTAPYQSHEWQPLDIATVCELISNRNAQQVAAPNGDSAGLHPLQ